MFTKYWKAWIALLGTVTTGVATVAVDPNIAAALPSGWQPAIILAGGVLTSYLTAAKRNQATFESVDAALETLPVEDLKAILSKWDLKGKLGTSRPLNTD